MGHLSDRSGTGAGQFDRQIGATVDFGDVLMWGGIAVLGVIGLALLFALPPVGIGMLIVVFLWARHQVSVQRSRGALLNAVDEIRRNTRR